MTRRKMALLLCILLAGAESSLGRDTRAGLCIRGEIETLAVSPTGSVWLTTFPGEVYHADAIDSNWRYARSLFTEMGSSVKISFFNSDIAILTGYFSTGASGGYEVTGRYFRTQDGGVTWQPLDYGGRSSIYDACVNGNGNAWMGGRSGEIFHSTDFGLTWKSIASPYNRASWLYAIDMLNAKEGVCGACENAICTTADNWRTCRKIETPYDQRRYTGAERGRYPQERILRIRLWDNSIVVNQNGHVFYTDKDAIDWKRFQPVIIDFEIDRTSNRLLGITRDLLAVAFSDPCHSTVINRTPLKQPPLSMAVADGALFVIDSTHNIYRIDSDTCYRTKPYTTDHEIRQPQVVREGHKLFWGATGSELYLSDNGTGGWYREASIDFSIDDILVVNDDTAILWDGRRDNYSYSLTTHSPKEYHPVEPLKNFLNSPIETLTIRSGSRGCFHSYEHSVMYGRKKGFLGRRARDTTLAASKFTTGSYLDPRNPQTQSRQFNNTVSGDMLARILQEFNSDLMRVPSIGDFGIDTNDIKNYYEFAERASQVEYSEFPISRNKALEFYKSVPNKLSSLDRDTIRAVLDQRERGWSTTMSWLTVLIVNEDEDSLSVGVRYSLDRLPWNLPWECQYRGLHFNCYSIEFSRFIDSCIPGEFRGDAVFDNRLLLMRIADYLFSEDEAARSN